MPAAAVPIRSVTRDVSSRRAGVWRCAVAEHEARDRDPERRIQPAECRRLGTAERRRRDIGVAEGDDRDPACRECPQQRQRRDRRLLQIVDQDQAKRLERAAPGDDGDRLGHELGRVDEVATIAVDDPLVLDDELCGSAPLVATGLGGQPHEPLRAHPVLDTPGHEFAQLGAEPAKRADIVDERFRPRRSGAVFEVAGEQLGDDLVLLSAGEQPWRLDCGGTGPVPDELEGERSRCARERSVRRHVEAQGDAIPEPCRRGAGCRERQHLAGRVAAVEHALGQDFDQGRGLSRSRSAEHGGRLTVVERQHRRLRIIELEVADACAPRGQGSETSCRHVQNRTGVRRQRT